MCTRDRVDYGSGSAGSAVGGATDLTGGETASAGHFTRHVGRGAVAGDVIPGHVPSNFFKEFPRNIFDRLI